MWQQQQQEGQQQEQRQLQAWMALSISLWQQVIAGLGWQQQLLHLLLL
jgi:hypothetical protein